MENPVFGKSAGSALMGGVAVRVEKRPIHERLPSIFVAWVQSVKLASHLMVVRVIIVSPFRTAVRHGVKGVVPKSRRTSVYRRPLLILIILSAVEK